MGCRRRRTAWSSSRSRTDVGTCPGRLCSTHKARSIGREERKSDRDAETTRLRVEHVTKPVMLLGREIRLLPNEGGELRAADGDQPADPAGVQRYIAKAFGDHLADVRKAMEELAGRYDPAELNRIGFRLYEKFRPDVPPGAEGWAKKAVLDTDKILSAG